MHQKSQSSINEKIIETNVCKGQNNICVANVLIGAIGASLSHYIIGIIFLIFSEKDFKKVF